MTTTQLRNPAQHHPTTTVRPPDFDGLIGYDSLDNLRIASWYCVPKPDKGTIAPPYPGLLVVEPRSRIREHV